MTTLCLVIEWRNPKADIHVAAIIQTLIFALGVFFTITSLRFLKTSNEFMQKQSELSQDLLLLERRRDLQANLISAFVSMEPRSSLEPTFILGLVYFLNSSALPVYDLRYRLLYISGHSGEEVPLPRQISNEGNTIRVIPPSKEPRIMFEIEGLREGVSNLVRSRDYLSKEKTQTNFFPLVILELTEAEILTLSIEISFRCSDESMWIRYGSGLLKEVFITGGSAVMKIGHDPLYSD